MTRIKCKYCGAKPKIQNAVVYRGIQMCHDCSCEYSKIFDGKQSLGNKNSNPLFNSFERGWKVEEMERSLHQMEIPNFIKEEYARLWEIEKTRWINPEVDQGWQDKYFNPES